MCRYNSDNMASYPLAGQDRFGYLCKVCLRPPELQPFACQPIRKQSANSWPDGVLRVHITSAPILTAARAEVSGAEAEALGSAKLGKRGD